MSAWAFAVTQIDWSNHESCTSVHLTFPDAFLAMSDILKERAGNGDHAEIVQVDYISGEGWEAKISEHEI